MSSTFKPDHEMPALAPARHRSGLSRYLLALVVAVVGIAAAVMYSVVAQAALANRADGFVRTSIPGTVAVHVDRTATYYVYAEGAISLHPSVQVTAPDGRTVTVRSASAGPSYQRSGNGGTAVGSFRAEQTGDFTVAVSTGTTAQGDFAVGGRFPLWLRLSDATSWTILVLFVGAGLGLAGSTAIRQRRARTA